MEHWVHPHLLSRLGNRLVIESAGQRRFVINGSKVKVKTRTCRDGVVYIIDRVLEVPMTAYSIGDVLRRLKGVSTMMKYLESTDAIDLLDRTDGNFTLFLPTDESLELVAHEKAWPLDNTSHMRSLVQYHILPQLLLRTDIPGESKYVALSGEEVRIKRSQNQIISAQSACLSNLHGSYTACNGVIHVIHSNFLRPATSNLFTLIHSNPRLHAFRTVIHLAGLDHLLQAKEVTYTVLAPIDDAFWKHPISTLHELFYDREKLKATLTYHLIEGAHYSCALLGDSNLRSLNGKRLRVRAEKVQRSEKILYFNYGQVLQKDIIASNGVIHILDDLLLYISKQNISRR